MIVNTLTFWWVPLFHNLFFNPFFRQLSAPPNDDRPSSATQYVRLFSNHQHLQSSPSMSFMPRFACETNLTEPSAGPASVSANPLPQQPSAPPLFFFGRKELDVEVGDCTRHQDSPGPAQLASTARRLAQQQQVNTRDVFKGWWGCSGYGVGRLAQLQQVCPCIVFSTDG